MKKVAWTEVAEFLEFDDTDGIYYKLDKKSRYYPLTKNSILPVLELTKIEWFIKEEN